jgi:hypothetical protein
MTSYACEILGGSEIDIPLDQVNGFINAISFEGVSGYYNYISIEQHDYIQFDNDVVWTASTDMRIGFEQLIEMIGTGLIGYDYEITKRVILYQPIVYASPRIRYLLGLSDEYVPTKPSNDIGPEYIFIECSIPSKLYLSTNQQRLHAGLIGSVNLNMFATGVPFSLNGFAIDDFTTGSTLYFRILNQHHQLIRFDSTLKWKVFLLLK